MLVGKIVHPFVRKNLNTFLKKNKKKNKVLDIPLLLENKINIKGNILIFVKSKRFKITKFLKKRANFNEKLYNIMRQNQFKPSYKEKKASKYMKGIKIKIFINLNLGRSEFKAYTCDLTNKYISLNADYRN